MPHPDDAADLRQRTAAGASVRTIAAELGVTERTVRNRLSRAGIPLPRAARDARIDVEALLAEYRAGTPVSHLAKRYGVSSAWITRRVAEHGVQRDAPLNRKLPPLRYTQLADRRWLFEQMADGRSVYAIARQLQTGARTVRDALRRHGLTCRQLTPTPSTGSPTSTTPRSAPGLLSGSSPKRPRWRIGRAAPCHAKAGPNRLTASST